MAKPVGLASGLIGLVTVSLYKTINSFRSYLKRVRDLLYELEALGAVLALLVNLVKSTFDVNLLVLDLPLLRCGNAYKEF
ncbi:hypothetical protein N7513_006888 [Penicillium frequentans]|nr:hypothetical protein N7513_006888 [Penicillium glabrum]